VSTGRSPGSTLGEALWTVPLSDGSTDLYIRQEEFHQQFAEDAPAEQTECCIRQSRKGGPNRPLKAPIRRARRGWGRVYCPWPPALIH